MDKSNIAYFEGQIDVVPRDSLEPYNGEKRVWIAVTSPTLRLAEVAAVMMTGEPQQIQDWVEQKHVQIHATLCPIQGDHFRAIWFEDAYVIQAC